MSVNFFVSLLDHKCTSIFKLSLFFSERKKEQERKDKPNGGFRDERRGPPDPFISLLLVITLRKELAWRHGADCVAQVWIGGMKM